MKFTRIVSILCFFVAASMAHAAQVVYYGENLTPGGTVSGAPAAARSAFIGLLSGVVNEDFEGFAVGDLAPLPLSFAGSTLSGSGAVENVTTNGLFNTTSGGSQWWAAASAFNIAFSTPIGAFGFYGTDIGDFGGKLILTLTDISDVVTTLTVPHLIDIGQDGALLFFGFIDSSNAYKSIAFGNTGNNLDFFGFDDMVFGNPVQGCVTNCGTVSEPDMLALLVSGLAGLALTRRRQQARTKQQSSNTSVVR